MGPSQTAQTSEPPQGGQDSLKSMMFRGTEKARLEYEREAFL